MKKTYKVNLKAPFLLCSGLLKNFKKKKRNLFVEILFFLDFIKFYIKKFVNL